METISMDQEPFMSMPVVVEIDYVDRNSTDNRADVIDDTYVISAKYDIWYDNYNDTSAISSVDGQYDNAADNYNYYNNYDFERLERYDQDSTSTDAHISLDSSTSSKKIIKSGKSYESTKIKNYKSSKSIEEPGYCKGTNSGC